MTRLVRFVAAAVVCSAAALLQAAAGSAESVVSIATSTDTAWLETLVSSWDVAGKLASPGSMARGVKDVRTAAYARLGEIGTPESLAAVRRIEATAKTAWKVRTMRFDRWTHPCWHFGDFMDEQKVATLNVAGGLTYTIVRDSGLLGDDDWFLLFAPSARWFDWQGAWLIPKPVSSDSRTFNLVYSQERGILIAFTKRAGAMLDPMNPVAAGSVPKIRLDGVTHLISAKEIQQDSDGDGWTDLEEERMGLDAHSVDSDGDGVPDLRDGCPDHAPSPKDEQDDDLKILQKAIFATFGLSGSWDLIFVSEGSRRLQLWGYQGPVLYKVNRKTWVQHHSAGIWVDWKIVSRNETEAQVDISDYEGPLAAGGQTITLKRIAGEWYVIKRETGPVS